MSTPVHTDLDTPRFVLAPEFRVPANDYPSHMTPIPQSRMFMIRDALKAYKAKMGPDAVTYDASQGDGGASLPGVPAEILRRAAELQIEHGSAYDQPWGTVQFRKAVVEQYWKLDAATGWGTENIAFVQGGRDGLQKAYSAMIALGTGEVGSGLVVSRVPWITYNWGPYAVGLNVILAPGRPEDGWKYTPDGIRACAELAAREGRKVAGIVITSPDNPTGRTISVDEQVLLAKTAIEAGFPFVLFDWIYHWITDHGPTDINQVLLAFTPEEREKIIILDGITKSLGASNIRSAHIVAGRKVINYITSQASHGVVPSYFAQAVAIAAYEMGFEQACATINEPTSASRKLLREALTMEGMPFIMGDGYYAFIDCSAAINYNHLGDSEGLLRFLGENFGLAIVPGVYFSDAGANWIRFSYATPPHITEGAVKRLFEGLKACL